MTEAQRQSGLSRISVLKNRNINMHAMCNVMELSDVMENEIIEQMAENQDVINQLEKATSARYEFLFNFEGGGWNSEWAHTKEEAMELAKAKYSTDDYKGTCVPDMKSFRVSTPADYNNLLSLFY
jgi:hypothetical protein